jgi:hypothetical protein
MRSFWRYSWITAQTSGRCCCTETGRPRRAQVSLGIAVREMEPLAGETVEVRREGIAEKCTGSGAVPGAVRGKGWQQIGGKRKRKRAERATHQRDKPRLGSATGGKAKSSRLLVFSQHGKTQPTHAATVEAVLTQSTHAVKAWKQPKSCPLIGEFKSTRAETGTRYLERKAPWGPGNVRPEKTGENPEKAICETGTGLHGTGVAEEYAGIHATGTALRSGPMAGGWHSRGSGLA